MIKKIIIATLFIVLLIIGKNNYDNAMEKCTEENTKEYCERGLK